MLLARAAAREREFAIRAGLGARVLAASVVAAIASTLVFGSAPAWLEPGLISFIDDDFRRLTTARRFNAGPLSMFGVLALIIGATGIYGIASLVASQQTRDIGVRLALGATRARAGYLVVHQSLGWIAAGTLLGLRASWASSSLLQSFVFGVSTTEPLVYAIVVGLLATVAVGATLVPAMRAARDNPVSVLRQ